MNSSGYIALAVVAVVIVGGALYFQRQAQAAAEAAAERANNPAAQIGGGIGGIVTGLVGLATGGSNS